MLTMRGWWFLLLVFLLLLVGVLLSTALLTVVGLTLLMWFIWEWFVFTLRVRLGLPAVRVQRTVEDERGPVTTLWAGKSFNSRVRVSLPPGYWLPFLGVIDRLPFQAAWVEGNMTAGGPVNADHTLEVFYRLHVDHVGQARFEGVRLQLADLEGFFFHNHFHRDPAIYRVLPPPPAVDAARPTVKRQNQLLPPGHHRLSRAGSGSELLDLRDYMVGDPPKTIAWKVSARRDKLITKEYESEVPIRCTLFIDTSSSVRVPTPQGPALRRLVELAGAVFQANTLGHDLTGVCLCGEEGTAIVRPNRNRSHQTRVLQLLADAVALAPTTGRVSPDPLIGMASALAQDVYPDLMRPEVNGMPWWVPWFGLFPGYSRAFSALKLLSRWKYVAFFFCPIVSPLVFGAILLSLARVRRLYVWRKRLAAILAVRHGLGPGGIELLLEDDDACSLHLQKFLNDHQVPYAVPLYDREGHYLFAAPAKIPVLTAALLRSVGRGRDNELFVLLVDLLELDGHLQPLLRAVSVALSRHHQVILIVPWPPGLPLPPTELPAAEPEPSSGGAEPKTVRGILRRSTRRRFHEAYARIRREFSRLGVTVACAASDQPVPLILERLDRLRAALQGARR